MIKGTKSASKATKTGAIKKNTTKPLSKKKQRALTKSSKVMIEKMNSHIMDDDIMNIMMSMETQTDTKAVTDGNESDAEKTAKDVTGLRGLKVENLKTDQEKDVKTKEKIEKTQSDIAEQLKMIEDFNL